MKHSPISASSSPLQLSSPSPLPSTSNAIPTYSLSSSGISPSVIIDETTSDVPLSEGLMRGPFVPKIEDTCSDSGMYTMNSMINESVSSIINEETVATMLSESASLMNNGTSSTMAGNASTSSANKFTPNCFMPNIKDGVSEMNWLLNQPPPSQPQEPSFASEPSFENWLGQIFKSDNLTAGCSLPQAREVAGNANYV